MNRSVLAILALFVTSTTALSKGPPAIGSPFKKTWDVGQQRTLCMTHSAQLDPCVELQVEGIKYQIAYREQTHRVSYLRTSDQKFRTVDGLKVGDSIPVSSKALRAFPGWEIHAPRTPDGWSPIIGYDGLRITLEDGSVLDLTVHKENTAPVRAVIIGFSKGLF